MTALVDFDAERTCLSGMAWASDMAQRVSDLTASVDFRGSHHAALYEAILVLHGRGEQVTVSSLRHACPSAPLEVVMAVLSDAPMHPLPPARIVADLAARRRASEALAKALDGLGDTTQDYGELVTDLRRALDNAAAPVVPAEPGPDIDTFLAQEVEHDWLVPDLLERGDRLILTGEEGRGKSTFLRQFAVQVAAGIYPFTIGDPCPPLRVLMVDCENSRAQVQRKIRPLRLQAKDMDPGHLVVKIRPDGLELDRRSDRRWLEEHVVANRPDLVITGPLYKLHGQDPTEEKPARALALFLDGLRTRYGFALLLEAHQPHASQGTRPLRPYGASLWKRWPEFGFGIFEDDGKAELMSWRGMRDERSGWPKALAKGGRWPWQHGLNS